MGKQGAETNGPKSVTNKCTSICGNDIEGRSCAKIMPVRIYPAGEPQRSQKIYAISDDQSNSTLGRFDLFDSLTISKTDPYHFTLTSCSGREAREGQRAFGLVVKSLDASWTMELPPVIECDEIPNERGEIPTPEVTAYFDHLENVCLPPLDPEAPIALLIGRDLLEAHVVQEQLTGLDKEPFAQCLALGWVLIVKVCLGTCHHPDNIVVSKTQVLGNGRPCHQPLCHYDLNT